MTQTSCPSCKRKGTYSPKHKQCAACGLGYLIAPKVVSTVPDDVRPEVLHDGRVTPVTTKVASEPKVVHSPAKAEDATGVLTESGKTTILRKNYDPLLVVGEPCPACGKKVGRRAYRERKDAFTVRVEEAMVRQQIKDDAGE